MEFKLSAFADEADSLLINQIAIMKKNDISYLEIRGVDGSNISDITPEKARQIKNTLDSGGISVWSIGSPYGKISVTDDFASHLEKFKRTLEVADILGTTHMRIFSFYVPSDNPEKYSDEVMTRLNKFISAAKNSSVLLCHENEKGIYGDVPERCLEIHRNLPEIKAVFDPANFIQCHCSTYEAWQLLCPNIEYLHIKDALPNGAVVPAGMGAGNIPFLLSQYKGEVLTVEPHLSVFDGLAKLEAEQKSEINQFRYPSSEIAFNAAVDALKGIISFNSCLQSFGTWKETKER